MGRIIQKSYKKIPLTIFTLIVIVLGIILLLPFLYFSVVEDTKIDLRSLMAIIYLDIVYSWLINHFWNKRLEKMDSDKNGLFLALEPVFRIIFGILLLGKRIKLSMILNSIFVILPIVLIAIRDLRL
ncbi:MAG: DMT family transporter [Flavobacteriales bacterium]